MGNSGIRKVILWDEIIARAVQFRAPASPQNQETPAGRRKEDAFSQCDSFAGSRDGDAGADMGAASARDRTSEYWHFCGLSTARVAGIRAANLPRPGGTSGPQVIGPGTP